MAYQLRLLPGVFAVCRLPPSAQLPQDFSGVDWFAIVRTSQELSLVCPVASVPQDSLAELGWNILEVQGPLAFDTIGVLSTLTSSLAAGGVSVFAVSTYNTDYLLVKNSQLADAQSALIDAGHSFVEG